MELIMDIVEKKGQKPDKLPERIILGRLELLLYLGLIRAEAKQTWDWKNIISMMATPSLLSQFPDVRTVAAQIIAVFFQSIGEPVKTEFMKTAQQIGVRQLQIDSVLAKLNVKVGKEEPPALEVATTVNDYNQTVEISTIHQKSASENFYSREKFLSHD